MATRQSRRQTRGMPSTRHPAHAPHVDEDRVLRRGVFLAWSALATLRIG
jgi:hypothetical protein